MANLSTIEWTDATWNVAIGCTKVDEDCKFCYMYRDSLKGTRYNPKQIRKTKTVFDMPLKLDKPSRIFTSSLTDFFHEDVDAFRDEAWDIIRRCPQHTFQILTKRPERIAAHLPPDWGLGWENVWLGASIGGESGMKRVIDLLIAPKAFKKFLSLEPLHEKLSITKIREDFVFGNYRIINALTGIANNWEEDGDGAVREHVVELTDWISWVIVGGESGNETGKYRYRPCEFEWIESIVNECKEANVPVFVKQMGTYLAKRHCLGDRHGRDIQHWPPNLQVREFPKTRKEVGNA